MMAGVDKLPVQLTRFVGRQTELAQLKDLSSNCRIVTLKGPGGCGKSRLALELSRQVLEEFEDGVWWVELAPIQDPGLIAPALAQALEVRPAPGQTEEDAVVSHLAPRRALLVLDNCEHLLDEAARIAERVASDCPSVRVICTSREALRAKGETEWRVPSLSLPPDGAGEDISDGSDAVRLFLERASQVRPGFALTEENASSIVAICRDLDGIPLAIELAAARLRSLSVEQIAAGLTDRFRVLVRGARTDVPRHQTLRASIDWSHRLLSNAECVIFRRLGVFVGGFTIEAAEYICGGADIGRAQVLDVVATLVERSLVQADESESAVRYGLLETIRQYALDRLDEAGEMASVRDAHRDFFLDLAERTEPELFTPRQPAALRALDPEIANMSLAIDRAASTEPAKALRICVALTRWWRLRSLFAQGEAAFVLALDVAIEPSALRARALWGRAFLLTFAGDLGAALPAAQEALRAAEEIGDDSTASRSLWLISIPMMWLDPAASRPGLERALALASATGDELEVMNARQALGMTYTLQDDHIRAAEFHDRMLRSAERFGQQDALAWYWLASALSALVAGNHPALAEACDRALSIASAAGDVVTEVGAVFASGMLEIERGEPERALQQLARTLDRARSKGGMLITPAVEWAIGVGHAAAGRLDEARSVLEILVVQAAGGLSFVLTRAHVSLAEVERLLGLMQGAEIAAGEGRDLASRIGDRPLGAEATLVLGRLAAARGEWAEAQRLHHEALPVAIELGTPRPAAVLEALAEVAVGLESHAEAARLLGAAGRLRLERGMVLWPHQLAELEGLTQRIRGALGAEAFDGGFGEGEALTLEEAVAYVRRTRGQRKRPSSGWESLTPRELEVARRAGAGLTNPEIAEAMFISRTTVRTHLTHIFAKLGVKTRAELAREVARRLDMA